MNPEPAHGGKHCNGTRALVRECSNTSSCHEAFPLRFRVGKNPSLGIMEIYNNSSWEKLCTSSWDKDEERLTCKAMGYSNNGVYDNGTWHTEDKTLNGSIHYNCTALSKCRKIVDNNEQLCKVQVRLNGENIEYGGRVEVFHQGKWGKICRNEWNFSDEKVICRQLGFSGALANFSGADVEDEGSIPFVMSDVACTGDESELASCERTDGKLNVNCQKDDKGAQALCETSRPVIQLLGPNKSMREGDSFNLTCKIVRGSPEPQLSWFKNGKNLKLKNRTLLLTNVSNEDEGRYTCRADNVLGVETGSIFVVVKTPPTLNPELVNRSVALNSTFTMKCITRGDPPLQINWTRNGVDLGSNNSNTFTIDRMTFKQAGLYGCIAVNWVGRTHTTFWINAAVSPQIYLLPRNQYVPEGYPANFRCKARGIPEPALSWNYNDGELPSDVNQTSNKEGSLLELLNTTKDMEGIYKCTAKNTANATTSSASLYVYEKPSAEVSPNPYPTLTAGDDLRLTCRVNKATVNIIWKKDGDPVSPKAQIDTEVDEKLSKLFIAEVVEGDSGEYSCEACNIPGIVARSTVKISVKVSPTSRPVLEWYHIVGLISGSFVIFAIGWYLCKRRRAAVDKCAVQGRTVEMGLWTVKMDKWEIAVDRILLQEVIGRGAFGAVWRALLKEPYEKCGIRTVAAKCFTPASGEDGRKSLMREIELGKLLGQKPQPNIVTFIGCVTTQVHPILVMEYLACGDLLGYLRKSRGIHDKYHLGQGSVPELEIYDLVLFAKQIAAGMVFLGSRGIIHRDLAARNVLLDDNFVCKVTDFGLAYQDFKYGHGNAKKGCMPIKWTAPEILSGNFAELSSKSDVWSYGIVLYEIFTVGGIPYPGWSEGKVVAEVLNGYQMPKPEHIDDKLYDVMTRCWNLNPDFRPPFENLRQRMDTYLREETYTELINMGRYDGTKYSKVEDLGAEDEPPTERVKTSSTGKKVGKWSSLRY
ncbi:fibroblast growth factor receptor 1-like isoform X1 [Oculina patagonica]